MSHALPRRERLGRGRVRQEAVEKKRVVGLEMTHGLMMDCVWLDSRRNSKVYRMFSSYRYVYACAAADGDWF